jgi:AraC-like DNA-binding protein
MMNCPNIGEAVQRLIKYYGLLSDLIIPIIESEKDYAYLTWKSNIAEINTNRHLSESSLIMLQSILQCLGCRNIIEVRFKHSQPEDISEHQRIFSGRLCFGKARNELVIESKDLFLPIALSNAELLDAHERVAEKVLERLHSKNLWTDKVTAILSGQLLNSINPDIETIARELAVSARKLQIHLKEESNTYQKLMDKVREEIAMNYIKEPNVTFYDIAFFLGFSEQSSFNHAFKRWTGTTPNDYRKKMRYSSSSNISLQ